MFSLVHTACSSSIRLSDDRILLPLASIVASSQNGDDPASDLVDTGTNAWCSVEPVNSGPHIVLTFTQPVVLTHMTGRGGVAGLSYVTEFSIQSQIGGVFEQYQQPNGTIVSHCSAVLCKRSHVSWVLMITCF